MNDNVKANDAGSLGSNGAAGTSDLRSAVRDHYAIRATSDIVEVGHHGPEQLNGPAELAGPILGCGNPLDRANLKPGEDVLDLGSGAGREVIEAASRIVPNGVAYGLDMTDEMLAIAQRTGAAQARSTPSS